MENSALSTLVTTLQGILTDAAEAAGDSFLQDGLLQDIPILNTLMAGYKTIRDVRDSLLREKLKAFVCGCKPLSPSDYQKVDEAILDDKKRRDLGTQIFLIIDRMDSVNKANLVGKIFRLLLLNQIDLSTFLRITHLIDKSFFDDLLYLKKFQEEGNEKIMSGGGIIEPSVLIDLYSTGWLTEYGSDLGLLPRDGGKPYTLNTYGTIIANLL